jgi:hypothetical protein
LEESHFLTSKYKKIVIETAPCWHQKRDINQWNRIERPEINPWASSQLILGTGAKNTQQRKDSPFNKWCWENWIAICKSINFDHYLTLPKSTEKGLRNEM